MSLYLFNQQSELIRAVKNHDFLSLVQTQEINGVDTLEADCLNADLFDEAYYMAVKDRTDDHALNIYKIVQKEKRIDGRGKVSGIQLAFDELGSHGYIKDIRPQNQTAKNVMDRILDGSGWSVRYVSSELSTASTSFYYISRLEAVRDFIEKWDAEVMFRVAIDGSRITDKWVDVYKRMGADTGKRFVYGSNLLEVIHDEDHSEIYTALVGRGKGEQVSSAEETGNNADGYGRKITFSEVEWKKSSGHPADKPVGQEYVEDISATAVWGFPDGSPRIGFVEFSEVEDPKELLRLTWEKLKEVSRPKIQLKTSVVNVGDMQLGDRVRIVHHDRNYYYEVRVRKITRDILDNYRTTIELGDQVVQSEAQYRKTIDSTLRKQLEVTYDVVQLAADGQTKIFRQKAMPARGMKKNDLWYKPIGDSREREMYVYTGTAWVLDKVSAGLLAGTLDAQRGDLNLINVNVANLVGETSEFVKSAWNGINSTVSVTGDGVLARHDDGSYTRLDGKGLCHVEGGARYNTNYLTYTIAVSPLEHSFYEDGEAGLKWVQLPDIFKGKQFYARLMISDVLNHTAYNYKTLAIQRIAGYVRTDRIDYARARVPVVGYADCIDINSGNKSRHPISATLIVTY